MGGLGGDEVQLVQEGEWWGEGGEDRVTVINVPVALLSPLPAQTSHWLWRRYPMRAVTIIHGYCSA